jgi:hypothetical protein
MGLDGPSRIIIVEPLEAPAPPERMPEPTPEREPVPEREPEKVPG